MRKVVPWLIVLVVAGVALILFQYAMQQTPPPQTPTIAAPAAKPPAEPETRYPIHRDAQEALPPLNASDPALKEALSSLWGEGALEQLFHLNDFVRRVVATVDNLPRETVALRLMPVKPTPGTFRTARQGDDLTVGPDNAARYAPYVQFATAIDSAKMVGIYVRFYPLFQQAYMDLGYTREFNDRLVEVIDHLLAAPEVPAQTRLVQPKVFYRYADADLESRSAGQKILMRIGNENAARIKAKLRDIRSELTRGGRH